MYSIWVAVANRHEAQYGRNKGQLVNNERYVQVPGQPSTFQQAQDRVAKLLATSAPGTKIKLVCTVPQALAKQPEHMNKAELEARIAELSALAAKAA